MKKLENSVSHLQRPLTVWALAAALVRLQFRREVQLKLELEKKRGQA